MAFVVFEGIDGSGKTSLIGQLREKLRSTGQEVLLTREPGGTPLGDSIRALLLTPDGETPTPRCELLLYQAARAQHVSERIRPALEKGSWVLCDRFTGSTVAFQAYARGLDLKEIEWLNSYATGGLQPDLTVLLDLDIREAEKRRQLRSEQSGEGPDRFEREKREFHEKVRQGYLSQAKASLHTNKPWLVLDASGSQQKLFVKLCAHLEGLKWPGF